MSGLDFINDAGKPMSDMKAALESGNGGDVDSVCALQKASDDHDLAQEHVKDKQQDRGMREKYAMWIFWLVLVWLAGMFVLIACCGARFCIFSDNVLIAILTCTTIDVLGLMAIVANYLFPKGANK